jgi:hypothetical protein
MSDVALAEQHQLAPATRKPARKLQISNKVRVAIEAMVWQGLKRDEAAQVAGLKDNSLYIAMRKPDVRAFYLQECEVLRISGRARRILRMEELSEQSVNLNAAVNATKALDLVEADAIRSGSGAIRTPGMVIQIVNQVSASQPIDPGSSHVLDRKVTDD